MPAMWDRLKMAPPKPVNNALDDDRIHMDLGLGYRTRDAPKGYSYSIKGGPPPPRPPREFLESRYLASAPAVQEPPPRNPNRIKVRTSNFRPPSSVYSETTPPLDSNYSANVATRYGYRYGGADEISPPSSPEPDVDGADRFLPGDVSPIDEDDGLAGNKYVVQPGTDRARDHERWNQPRAPAPRQGTQSPPQNRAATSIPMMRRERRKQTDAARGPPQQQLDQSRDPPAREAPRWDPLTGEQTNSSRGRPSQVNPAEFAQGLGITSHAWTPQQSSATSAPQSFGDRVRRIAKKAAAAREGNTDPAAGAFTSSRPGWRGASGRTALVDPVKDTTEVAPLKIPEKSSRRNISGASNGGPFRRGQTPPISPPPGSETGTTRSGPREAIKRILPSSHQGPAGTQTSPQTAQRYPSPPLSGTPLTGDAPAVAARELARDSAANVNVLSSPTPNESANSIRRKPPPVHTNLNHQHQVSVSSVYSQDVPQSSPSQIRQAIAQQPAEPSEDTWVQPPSRFSITTYATSNTGTTRDDLDDLGDEDQPPVPALPADLQQQNMSAIAKGRPSSESNSPVTSPIDQFMTSPFSYEAPTTNTTTMFTHPALARITQQESPATSSADRERPSSRASDINKTLPPAPPEQSAGEAQDRVAMLNAQLRALANRRININRSIAQMTELMPTDKLMNTPEVVRKRESEKKKVEALRQELADVQREEYELGLKLHRAYKRLDREGEWEVTGLWVRRVTG